MRCAVALVTPVEAANAAIPAELLPPARFAAASPALSWLVLMPADEARPDSASTACDCFAAAVDAGGFGGVADGVWGPDANAAVGTPIAAAGKTPATARRPLRTDMTHSFVRSDASQSSGTAQDEPSDDLKET